MLYQSGYTDTVDYVAGPVIDRVVFHQAVLTIFAIEVKCVPNQHRGRHSTESDTEPLGDAAHIHYHEQHEIGYQASGKDEKVLRLQPLVFHRSAYALVDSELHSIRGRTSAGLWRRQ